MFLSNFDVSTKQIFWGNLLLVICCAFYLTWWWLAFKPIGAIKGIKTGWLLIPAFIAGGAAVILIIRCISDLTLKSKLFSDHLILCGGVAAYLILLAVTVLLLKRPITSELLLIVGWAMLALSEINVLFGLGRFSHRLSLIFVAVILLATFISLICYVLYYTLDQRLGFVDGMVPLILAAIVMISISVAITVT